MDGVPPNIFLYILISGRRSVRGEFFKYHTLLFLSTILPTVIILCKFEVQLPIFQLKGDRVMIKYETLGLAPHFFDSLRYAHRCNC